MNFDELINKICGELPEGYRIIIECENGYGGVKLMVPETDAEIEGFQDETSIEKATLDLLEHAKHNSEIVDV